MLASTTELEHVVTTENMLFLTRKQALVKEATR